MEGKKHYDKSSLQYRILEMFYRQHHVDVKFKVKTRTTSKIFTAHALILAIRSPVLADAFYKTDGELAPLVLNSSIKGFEVLLRYLYTDCISSNSPEELIEMSKAAGQLQIGGTTNLCRNRLESVPVSINNICSMLKASQYFKMKNLLHRCLSFIQEIPNDVLFECSDFRNTSKDVVSTILSMKKFPTLTSTEIAIRWVEQRKISGRAINPYLAKPPVSSLEFMNLVENFPSFSSCKFFKDVADILGKDVCPIHPQNHDNYSHDIRDTRFFSVFPVKTDCTSKCFPQAQFLGEDEFESSAVFEIKVSRQFPKGLHLEFFELAFGSNFVPRENLEIQIFLLEPNSTFKTRVQFAVMTTPEHFHLRLNRKVLVHAWLPVLFCLHLRAFGLKKWRRDGPVSDSSLRVALVPVDIFYNMRLKAFGQESVCITFLSDWLLFVDPIRQEKRPFLTSLTYSKDHIP